MVASLIEQLFRNAENVDLKRFFDLIKPLYDRIGSSLCSESEEDLWKLLSEMLATFSRPVIVLLDALDECINPNTVITHLRSITSRSLVTSRPEPDICEAFKTCPPEYSVMMDVGPDIVKYINSAVRNDRRLQLHRDAIISKVNQTADGMFRYAGLMLEELQRTSHDRKVTEILESLPSGLSEMYALMLQRLPPELSRLRNTTFMFISGAFRPVTVEEVAYANGVKPGEEFNPQELLIATKEEILRACGSLVEVFESYVKDFKGTVEVLRFSHLTVKDFLLSSSSATYTIDRHPIVEDEVHHPSQFSIQLHSSLAYTCGSSIRLSYPSVGFLYTPLKLCYEISYFTFSTCLEIDGEQKIISTTLFCYVRTSTCRNGHKRRTSTFTQSTRRGPASAA